jgi:hypothetical protein
MVWRIGEQRERRLDGKKHGSNLAIFRRVGTSWRKLRQEEVDNNRLATASPPQHCFFN